MAVEPLSNDLEKVVLSSSTRRPTCKTHRLCSLQSRRWMAGEPLGDDLETDGLALRWIIRFRS